MYQINVYDPEYNVVKKVGGKRIFTTERKLIYDRKCSTREEAELEKRSFEEGGNEVEIVTIEA
jgi:hypothetical protein